MTDEYYMMMALKEARKAFDAGEVPVGTVILMGGKIIGRGYNQVEQLTDPTAHAEIIALTSAFNFPWKQVSAGSYHLYHCRTLPYVCRCIVLE
jgi:tRNA(Arg) A34 adenosine deaminase TadA